jgi:hypothetical protein
MCSCPRLAEPGLGAPQRGPKATRWDRVEPCRVGAATDRSPISGIDVACRSERAHPVVALVEAAQHVTGLGRVLRAGRARAREYPSLQQVRYKPMA